MVADSGKPHTKPEDNAAATDSDAVNPEDQDKSEAPSSANQGAEQNSAEDKDQEPQAAVGEHCGTDDSLTAYEVGVSYIEPYRGSAWRPDVDAYDPCAELSWITITLEGATGSSPYHIMLYHHGDFLGTATAEPYAFSPRIQQVNDSEIAVTYRWPREGEGNANPSGRTHAGFHWDDAQEKIIMTGDVPSY